MPNDIKCPNCGHHFDVENVIAAEIEQKFQQQFQEKLQQSLIAIEQDKNKLCRYYKNYLCFCTFIQSL